jgi:hypothetical protein
MGIIGTVGPAAPHPEFRKCDRQLAIDIRHHNRLRPSEKKIENTTRGDENKDAEHEGLGDLLDET